MTPYQTPHHQHTPRYGQQTPSPMPNAGNFLHPPQRTPIVHNSPHPSPHSRSYSVVGARPFPTESQRSFTSEHSYKSYSGSQQESAYNDKMDWQKAAEAWAARSKGTPKDRTPRYDSKSLRSARSTPRTNISPHSMSLGDQTSLYDENV